MSEENVEIVMRYLDTAREDPDAVWGIFDDDVEWDLAGIPSAPDFPGISHGPDAVREFFRRWAGAFNDWGYETEEVIDGPGVVAVRIHQWGRGKGSGIEVSGRFWQIWTMRDGKAVRVTHSEDRADALRATGRSV
ncbi:MAG: nuclear transport factor 2 family protein [Solirubrobacterales bacterium]